LAQSKIFCLKKFFLLRVEKQKIVIFVREKQHSNTTMAKLVSANLSGDKLCTLTYTTTDGEMLSFDENAFDAKIISHSYADNGVIIFDNPISYIGDGAFYSRSIKGSSLKSVTIPDCVIRIGERAFYGCEKLTCITIPDSVSSIGGYAFDSCISLSNVIIGNGVTTIGNGAFCGCRSLTSITLHYLIASQQLQIVHFMVAVA
jgi:hypothetical protein